MTSPIRAALNRGQKPHFGVITVDAMDKLDGDLGLALADRDRLSAENADLRKKLDQAEAKLDVLAASKSGTTLGITHDAVKAAANAAKSAAEGRLSQAWQKQAA